jgi:hypothetical protein
MKIKEKTSGQVLSSRYLTTYACRAGKSKDRKPKVRQDGFEFNQDTLAMYCWLILSRGEVSYSGPRRDKD